MLDEALPRALVGFEVLDDGVIVVGHGVCNLPYL